MATVTQDEETPANVAQPSAPVAAGGAGVVGGKTAKVATPTTAAAATPGVNVPAQPSAQLSAYLNANAPQATALAGNVASTVGGQVNAAGQAILPAVNTYTGSLVNVQDDPTLDQTVATSPSSLTAAQQQAYETELGAAAQTPNSAQTFETTAPYASLTTQIQNAVEQANLWNAGNNVADLSTALQPYEAPTATTGDMTLDSLLLSQTPGAYSQIESAVAPAAGLQGQLNAGASQADAGLQSAIAADQASTTGALGAANTFNTNLTNYLNSTVAADQAAAGANTSPTEQGLLPQDLTSQNLSAADLAALGITAEQWGQLQDLINFDQSAQTVSTGQGIGAINLGTGQTSGPTVSTTAQTPQQTNLGQYLTQNQAGNINDATVATPQEYADLAALQSLLGTDALQNVPLSAANAGEAGTAPASLNDFNYAGAMGAEQQQALKDLSQLQAAEQASDPNVTDIFGTPGPVPNGETLYQSGSAPTAQTQAEVQALINAGLITPQQGNLTPTDYEIPVHESAASGFQGDLDEATAIVGPILASIGGALASGATAAAPVIPILAEGAFGVYQGGEIRKPKNMAEYLGAKS